jgi:predicted PurR-regulated permease PerM
MSFKKKPESHFQTFRLFGKHAQKILETARGRLQTARQSEEVQRALPPEEGEEKVIVHLAVSSIVKAAVAILGIVLFTYLCYAIRDKILLLLLAILLAVVIDPGVTFLERMRLPRGFAILLVYLVTLTLLLFLVVSLIPIIADQIQQMAVRLAERIDAFLADPTLHLPFLSQDINQYLNNMLRQVLADISTGGTLETMARFGQRLSSAAQGSLIFVVGVAGSVVQFVVQLIFVLVLAFFFQLEKEGVIRWVRVFLPYRYRRYAEGKAEAIHRKLAQWIHGQLMLCLAIGILVFAALSILRMPYALTLAVLAGFTEFIPVVGPIVAAIPAIFIALAQSGLFPAMVVAIVYYGIQWCENNLLVPLIMKRAVGLSPIAVMFAMLVGVSFPDTVHPVLGVLLAVPVSTIISIFIQDYRSQL